MYRFGVLFLLVVLGACGGTSQADGSSAEDGEGSGFAQLFPDTKLPYILTDTALLNNDDTTQIRSAEFRSNIPDSIATSLFGKKDRIRYVPLGRFTGKKGETYLLVSGTRDNRKAALLLVQMNDSVKAVLPFLVADNDAKTRQSSTIAQNGAITRAVQRTLPDDAIQEGKDVFAYSQIGGTFDLVMTDPLDDEDRELINPIDTLGKRFKYAGDYTRNKRNLVSVRDGRKQGLITVFVHLEANNGSCTGEVKGDAELVDATTAVYKPAGDPCVLTLKFGKNAVTIEEQEGCGSKRGLECSFNGTYNKKKEPKPKAVKG